jgi:hypothetical protein
VAAKEVRVEMRRLSPQSLRLFDLTQFLSMLQISKLFDCRSRVARVIVVGMGVDQLPGKANIV